MYFASFLIEEGGTMKKLFILSICFVIFSPFVFSYDNSGYYSNSYARLNYVKGDVFIQRVEDLGYEEGIVNLPIVEGDKVGTRDGRAEIHFGKNNYLRIDRYAQIDLANLPDRRDNRIAINLLSGSIYLRIDFLESEKDFEVHTPDASFYILDEGLYRFDVRENMETEAHVFNGSIEAAGEEKSYIVEKNENIISSDGYFNDGPSCFYSDYEDSFSEWNSSRDVFHNRSVSSRYLPSELYEYESELDSYGRWVYEAPYGYVWTPHVSYYSWRPYYYGRWVWYPIIGWTWVSSEPWGWCVTHYGRWHWRMGLGWYWIPTRIWSPAWVNWYWGPDYVGWCPLSYYGYPCVIINNHFYGRYYDRYYPLNSRAFTVVRKNQLQAPHVSRIALSQNKVTKLRKISLSSKQPGIKPVINHKSTKQIIASKALSRSNTRGIKKSYPGVKVKRIRKDKNNSIRSNNKSKRSNLSSESRKVSNEKKIKSYKSHLITNSSENRVPVFRKEKKDNYSYPSRTSTRSNIKRSSSRNSSGVSQSLGFPKRYSSQLKRKVSGSIDTRSSHSSSFSNLASPGRSYNNLPKSYSRSKSFYSGEKSYSRSKTFSKSSFYSKSSRSSSRPKINSSSKGSSSTRTSIRHSSSSHSSSSRKVRRK